MMRARAVLLLIAALVAATSSAPSAHAAMVAALVRSGDLANDGLGVDTILRPAAHSASDAAFVGTTSAIVIRTGATTAVLAQTGDGLGGGAGTFNAVYDPAIDDAGTRVAFAATLNGNAAGGVFLAEGGAPVPVWIGDGVPTGVALNGVGDVAFQQGSVLTLVPHGATAATAIASLADPVFGTTVRRGNFGRPELNDAGAMAFVVDNRRAPGGGVFAWSAATGVAIVGRAGDASPLGGRSYAYTRRQVAAINAAGQVAFTATLAPDGDTAVFVWDPGTGITRTVASVGTVIGTTPLTSADAEYVGIDASGRVTFQGRFGTTRRLVRADGATFTTLGPIASNATDFDVGVTAGGRLGWIRGGNVERFDGAAAVVLAPGDVPLGGGFTLSRPGISDGGTVVCGATRSALYRVTDGSLRAVARDGDAIGGVGPLTGVDAIASYAYRGDALVALVGDGAGRQSLGIDRGDGLVKIVASGDASPTGGTFEPSSAAAVEVSRRKIVFSSPVRFASGVASGLFSLRLGARPIIKALVKPGDAVPGGGTLADVELIGGAGKPIFRGSLTDGRSGLFALRGRRPAVLALSGDAAPGAGVFGDVRTVAVDGERVVFTALLGPSDDAPQGLFRVRGGRVQKIAASGDVAPAGGTFASFAAVEVAGDRAVFSATVVEGSESRTGVFRGRPGRIETLILAGDPLDGGATLALDSVGRVAVDGTTIGFVGSRIETNGTQSAVFEIRRRTVGTVAVAGDPTPVGGFYGGFTEEAVAPADGALVFAASVEGVADARMGLFAATHDGRR